MNSVQLIGNLTRDPDLRHTASGTAVCNMRIAVNDRRKNDEGEWVDVPYYFDVTAWGGQAERCAEWLAKGRKIGVTGKLTWREWLTNDGEKRQNVEINAFHVDFLTPKSEQNEQQQIGVGATTQATWPPSDPADDDIPF